MYFYQMLVDILLITDSVESRVLLYTNANISDNITRGTLKVKFHFSTLLLYWHFIKHKQISHTQRHISQYNTHNSNNSHDRKRTPS